MRAETPTTWVVYEMSLFRKAVGCNAVCEQTEWDAMELARPGYHTLVQAGIASEGEAEKVARAARPTPRTLDPATLRDTEALLRMCAWCKRIAADGDWLEVEEAGGRLRLFDRPAVPTITHGICDPCFNSVMTEFKPVAPEP